MQPLRLMPHVHEGQSPPLVGEMAGKPEGGEPPHHCFQFKIFLRPPRISIINHFHEYAPGHVPLRTLRICGREGLRAATLASSRPYRRPSGSVRGASGGRMAARPQAPFAHQGISDETLRCRYPVISCRYVPAFNV
ncbi:hypothetical protein C5748_03600 [Phyllobacterium phragmitis]|uniref:Uncharacterized protein n=1 Tax=Phyllobacterium phragmitis TaxID=2670329 RepID=A0A2S9IXP5_9HYPH|nr:hypothetical protein C5748_03600 [Phyllobacterium phragmitis]